MGLFNRKLKEKNIHIFDVTPPPHEHVWKDMPWYMEVSYNTKEKTAEYTIIEPYICISCGERKNQILEHNSWSGITPKERDEIYTATKNKYKNYLKPRAVVEDMINNILLVKDPERLDMLEKMYGLPHRGCGTSNKMQKTDFRIELERNKNNA